MEEAVSAIWGQDARATTQHLHKVLEHDPDCLDAHWLLIWYGPEQEKELHCQAIVELDPHTEYAYVAKLALQGAPLPVYGNPETWRFHRASCLHVARYLNKMIRFKSAEEAVMAWYEGCLYCNADPNNLLAAQQAKHRQADENFEQTMQDLQKSIAQRRQAQASYAQSAAYHRGEASDKREAAEVEAIETGQYFGGVQLVTGRTVVPEAAREQLRELAAQHALVAAQHQYAADHHGYLAQLRSDELVEENREYEVKFHKRQVQHSRIEAAACVRQALDIRDAGRVQRAVELLTRAVELQPDNNEYKEVLDETTSMWADEVLEKAQSSCEQQDFETAITLAQGVIALYPKDQRAIQITKTAIEGELCQSLRDVEELRSRKAYKDSLVELQEIDKLILTAAVLSNQLSETYVTAKKAVEEARQTTLDALMATADDLFVSGNYRRAAKLYQTALPAGGSKDALNHKIAACQVLPQIADLHSQGKTSENWTTYLELLKAANGYEQEAAFLLKDAPRQGQLVRSLLLETTGDFQGAGDAYRCFAQSGEESSERAPEQAQVCLVMAAEYASRIPPVAFHRLTDRVLPALACAVEAVHLSPANSKHQGYASLLYIALGHFDRAYIHAREALEHDPTEPLSRVAYIVSAIRAEETADAMEHVDWLLEHRPDVGYIHFLAACAYELEGAFGEAQAEVRIAASKDRNFSRYVGPDVSFWEGLGQCMKAISQEVISDTVPEGHHDFSKEALTTILMTGRPMR